MLISRGSLRSGKLHSGANRSEGLHGGNLRSGVLHGGALQSEVLHLGSVRRLALSSQRGPAPSTTVGAASPSLRKRQRLTHCLKLPLATTAPCTML